MNKNKEHERYEKKFKNRLKDDFKRKKFGSSSINPVFRSPYLFFEKMINVHSNPSFKILELGAGDGKHTEILLSNGAKVTASDISQSALQLLKKSLLPQYKSQLKTKVANIEDLPFDKESFDLVTSAGSLSYGLPDLVLKEVKRVLKPGGFYIAIDSLNENPIYRLNRFIQYLLRKRSFKTIKYMPDNKFIGKLKKEFEFIQDQYFGSLLWITPLTLCAFYSNRIVKFLNKFDEIYQPKSLAFKFVIVLKKHKK